MNEKGNQVKETEIDILFGTAEIITVTDIRDYWRKAAQSENATKTEKANLNYWENVKLLLENRKTFPEFLEKEFAEKAKGENKTFEDIIKILQGAEEKLTAIYIENESILEDTIAYYDKI